MDNLFFVATQKLAVIIVLSASAIGGLFASGTVQNAASSQAAQTAIIATEVHGAQATTSPSSTWPTSQLPAIAPGLLASSTTSTPPFCTASSTCGIKALRFLAARAIHPTTTIQKITSASNSSTSAKKVKSTLLPASILTTQQLLAATTLNLREQRSGPFEAVLNASSSNGENVTWELNETTIGGSGNVPPYTASYSCDPAPTPADPGAFDQNPTFQPQTNYDCSLSLTPLSGTDLRTQSRDFPFTTPAGALWVTSSAATNSILTNNTNQSGIVFHNNDIAPVTITGATFDVSYTDMNDLGQPLILRILDPVTNQSLVDYPLKTASDPASATQTNTQTGITIPLSFTVPAADEKMLPVAVVGVQKMTIPGTSPTLSVMLTGVTTNRPAMKTTVVNADMTWSCSVPTAGYDPNATSGPFFSGTECRN